MVYGTQITIVSRVYKPTNITGGPHIVSPDITMNYWLWSLQYHISGIFTNINHIYIYTWQFSIPVYPRFSRFSSALLLVLLPGPGRGRRPETSLAAGGVGCLAAAKAGTAGWASSKDWDLTGNGQEFQCREATFQSDILGSATSVQARIPKKENPTNERTKTVFDRQKTMGESQGNLGRVLRKVPFWEKDHGGDFVEESLAVFFGIKMGSVCWHSSRNDSGLVQVWTLQSMAKLQLSRVCER